MLSNETPSTAMEIGRMLGRITRAAGTALDIDSHAGLAAATPEQRTARGDEKSNHAKRRQTWSDPSVPRNSTFTTKLRFCTSAFRRGVDIESWKSAGKRRRTTPQLKIQICITNLRSRLFNPTPNITISHLHLCAMTVSQPRFGPGMRCARQRGTLPTTGGYWDVQRLHHPNSISRRPCCAGFAFCMKQKILPKGIAKPSSSFVVNFNLRAPRTPQITTKCLKSQPS